MFTKTKRIIGIVILAVFLISSLYIVILRAADSFPTFLGYCIQRVDDDTMVPKLDIGDVVIVKRTAPEKLNKDDCISYKGDEYPVDGMLVLHQIVEDPRIEDGKYYFTTRGIKSGALNDPEIDETQIYGKVLYVIPLVGTLYDFFSQWYGMFCFAALIIIIYSNELFALINKIMGSFKKEIADEVPADDSIPEYNPIFNEVLAREADEIITKLDEEI